MNTTSDRNNDTYKVVVNQNAQYSIWDANRELPHGWEDTGISGTKENCLTYIDNKWIDMRPLSLRKKMDN
jgi:MbtH protein